MNIFYCPLANLDEYSALDETESRHIANVLRKREGEELFVFDGRGNLFDARIQSISKNEVMVHVVRLRQKDESNKPKLHIAIAPPKNIERFEWFVEKATEIGVNEITPLLCKHSERKELRADRIEKILLGACKQSLKLTLPVLNPVLKVEEFLARQKNTAQKYIAYCDEKAVHLKNAYQGNFDAVIMIGPEGDFNKEEVLLAAKHEFETVSLGKSRLRLETAGIFAASVFNLANE
ncbi:MAG: RsmE family RNA methyltransferase [Bacteroidetes bacterium]|nr:RsmE family RNA methyltransferase [Bacteroidota bacterium]